MVLIRLPPKQPQHIVYYRQLAYDIDGDDFNRASTEHKGVNKMKRKKKVVIHSAICIFTVRYTSAIKFHN